jgi:hypothetical protein
LLGRTLDRPVQGGAHYAEMPTFRSFTVVIKLDFDRKTD